MLKVSETVAQGLVIYDQSFFILTECGACGVACCTDLEVASSSGQWSTGYRSALLCGDSDWLDNFCVFFSLLQWIINQALRHFFVRRSWIQAHRPPAPRFRAPVQRQDEAFKPFKKDRLRWANHHLHREAARRGKDVSDSFWFRTVQSDQSLCMFDYVFFWNYSAVAGKDTCIFYIVEYVNICYNTFCGCMRVEFCICNILQMPIAMGHGIRSFRVITRVRLDSRPTLSRCVWLPPLHLSSPFPSHRLAPVQVNAP